MRYATILLLLLISATAATALSASAQISPQNPLTTDKLNCLVTATGDGDLQANITWYQNSNPYTDSDETLTLTSGQQRSTSEQGEIPTSATTKEQTWTCEATIYNQTDTLTVTSTQETIQNSPPSVTAPTNQQIVTEGEPYFLVAQATDPDGDTIVSWSSSDLNESEYGAPLFTITNNGVIEFTPTYEQRGNHTMLINAFDGELVGGRSVLYTVEIINQPPQFNPPLQNQAITQNTQWEYTINATDREGDPFNFSMLSSTLNTVEFEETSATGGVFTLTTGQPRYEDRGLHNITVMVYEEGNTSHNTTETFQLNVSVENDPPTLDFITSPQATQGGSFDLNVTASDPNIDDTLEFFITAHCPISNPWTITTVDDSHDSALGRINVAELTNDHVICRDVTIRVRDFDEQGNAKAQDNQTLTLNITNVNDPPVLFEIADKPGTYEQTNMSALEAAQDLPFTYYTYADDPDLLTYEGDELTYTTNTTVFSINEETGVINFTPTISDVGEHLINVTVTDREGLSDSRVMNLTIYANTAPNLQTIPSYECAQDSLCEVNLSAQDPDANENLTFTIDLLEANPNSNETHDFNWEEQTNTWNTSEWTNTYTNNMVGEYLYNITVTDRWGAYDYQTWFVNATNINDAPFFDNNKDGEPDNITLPLPFVDSFEATFNVRATDIDFINDPNENLTLTINTTGPNPGLLGTPSKTAKDAWFISFTPQAGDVGSYNTTFTVTDAAGASDTRTYSYEVLNQSIPPNITSVQPYLDASTQETVVNNQASTADMNQSTNVTLQEPLGYTFNFSYEDPDSAPENITVDWYINDELVQSTTADQNYAYQEQYDFFSTGNYTYQVILTDERYASTNFTWNVEVENTNRPPVLLENLTNRNITQTTLIQGMLGVFYDPDDDLEGTGAIDGNDTNNLAFTYTDPGSALDIEIDGTDVKFIPKEQATITMTWMATDPYGASVTSNEVTYDVEPPEDETIEPQPAGGGGGGSAPVPIPIQQDPEPESVQILIPESLTIHRNETIEAPVSVENTGARNLREIVLSAHTEAENVSFEWRQSLIRDLQPGEVENTTLLITNFRPQGTYDIHVTAESTDPAVNDTAIILINSLEQARQGDEAVQTRVTFARDLFASNPECLELNEVLEQASNAAQRGDSAEASRLIDAAIDGCRYLIGDSNRRLEEPRSFSVAGWLGGYRYANQVLAGLLIVLLGVGGFLVSQYVSAARVAREEENR